MNEPTAPIQTSIAPYAITMVILVLFDVLLCGGIIWLRPTYDPLAIITGVSLAFATMITSIWNLIRGQVASHQLAAGQHAMRQQMNGTLAALLEANTKVASAEGHRAGVFDEQARAKSLIELEKLQP